MPASSGSPLFGTVRPPRPFGARASAWRAWRWRRRCSWRASGRLARGGRARVAIEWTDDVVTSAEPPAYLDQPRAPIRSRYTAALPVGTVLAVHAAERHPGHELVLSDGERQVPFHDDGHGGVV